ncbi:hypothetical protein TNCV_2568951, partial [Trichonephila clavipes]
MGKFKRMNLGCADELKLVVQTNAKVLEFKRINTGEARNILRIAGTRPNLLWRFKTTFTKYCLFGYVVSGSVGDELQKPSGSTSKGVLATSRFGANGSVALLRGLAKRSLTYSQVRKEISTTQLLFGTGSIPAGAGVGSRSQQPDGKVFVASRVKEVSNLCAG